MGDYLLTALGAATLGFFIGACRYEWAHRRVCVWDYQRQEWRAAGSVMRDRHHRAR